MKILVTGYKGFIGSNMVKMLDPHTVTGLEWGEPLPNITDFEWVIHMGAISSTIERDVNKVMTQNYDFSCHLLDMCLSRGVNFQYSSSASVYGLISDFNEDSPVDPKTPYAWSKYMFERYATKAYGYAKDNNIKIQGFRYFNVYGPGEEHKGNQASPFQQFRKQKEQNGVIKVFEKSDQYLRDFVPVETVCQTHIDFFNVPESGIWNVGTGKPMSFLDVAKTFGAEITEIPMPDILKDSYQKYTCADMTKLHRTMGRIT